MNILIADDHPIVRNGLKQILQSAGLFKNIEETGDGEAALNLLQAKKYDIAILDMKMPAMNGIDVIICAKEKGLNTKFIIMTMYNDETAFNKAMDAGALGYILKENALDDVFDCIKSVAEGEPYISPALSKHLLSRGKKDSGLESLLSSLTTTERKILVLLSEMKTSKEIAEKLFVSTKTIENHRSNICTKLNIKGSHALMKFALDNKTSLHS